MLLFVMNAQNYNRLDLVEKFVVCLRKEIVDVLIDC